MDMDMVYEPDSGDEEDDADGELGLLIGRHRQYSGADVEAGGQFRQADKSPRSR